MDSNSPCKDLLFRCGLNPAQKPLNLVGTVLNSNLPDGEDGEHADSKIHDCTSSKFKNQFASVTDSCNSHVSG